MRGKAAAALQALAVGLLVAGITYAGALGPSHISVREAWGPPITVVRVHYRLDAADPSLLQAVELELLSPLAPGARLAVRLDGRHWHLCRVVGKMAQCPLVPQVPVAEAERLEVRALP